MGSGAPGARRSMACSLREKQKVRRYYGVLETPVPQALCRGRAKGGVTGDNLLQILESRLDNVVYRMGFADSRQQARQLVRHGHFVVNGRKTEHSIVPGSPGDEIRSGPRAATESISRTTARCLQTKRAPDWLEREHRRPEREGA